MIKILMVDDHSFFIEGFPDVKVIALTGETDASAFFDIWNKNVNSILSKTCGFDELTSAINGVMKGLKIIGKNLRLFFDQSGKEKAEFRLIKREKIILNLIGSDLTRQETTDKLKISIDNVNLHCKNIFRKYNTKKMTSMVNHMNGVNQNV